MDPEAPVNSFSTLLIDVSLEGT
jgi:hypothetical protein